MESANEFHWPIVNTIRYIYTVIPKLAKKRALKLIRSYAALSKFLKTKL